jgi:hypothetical protein
MKLYMIVPVLSLCLLIACTQYGSVAKKPDGLPLSLYPHRSRKPRGRSSLPTLRPSLQALTGPFRKAHHFSPATSKMRAAPLFR